jgi:hypothetical protein
VGVSGRMVRIENWPSFGREATVFGSTSAQQLSVASDDGVCRASS